MIQADLIKCKEIACWIFRNNALINIRFEGDRILFENMLQNTKDYLFGWEIGEM